MSGPIIPGSLTSRGTALGEAAQVSSCRSKLQAGAGLILFLPSQSPVHALKWKPRGGWVGGGGGVKYMDRLARAFQSTKGR